MTRIAIKQETLEIALVELQECKSVDDNNRGRHQAITAIKQALAAQPAVPDAITDDSESPEYRTGWNDCRQAMLEMMK
jgi:hypothetical protein